ncbi:hypothetical protein CW304_13380 [Bacillus sp. UFRGS-B20]|nr:hypothetical protein CW304_13380 [Bacillus sp. UFRGS-B20]
MEKYSLQPYFFFLFVSSQLKVFAFSNIFGKFFLLSLPSCETLTNIAGIPCDGGILIFLNCGFAISWFFSLATATCAGALKGMAAILYVISHNIIVFKGAFPDCNCGNSTLHLYLFLLLFDHHARLVVRH